MKRIIQIVIIQFFCYSNAYSELNIKIDRAKIGALPIMISVSGQSENFPPNQFRDIIENDLYSSGYFNILDSSKVKNNVSNQNHSFQTHLY